MSGDGQFRVAGPSLYHVLISVGRNSLHKDPADLHRTTPGTMRTARFLAPALLAVLVACANDPGPMALSSPAPKGQASRPYGRSVALKLDIADADLIQRTCALYVTVRSHALKDQISFGREVDDHMVRWNTCPGGTMVACAVAPTANGDTVVTGIAWTPVGSMAQ
jgi:hypothetical protein